MVDKGRNIERHANWLRVDGGSFVTARWNNSYRYTGYVDTPAWLDYVTSNPARQTL